MGNGEHLGLVLSRLGIMQKDAAAAVGVDPAMVTRWKNGTERLSADSPRMAALVDYLLSPAQPLSEADLRWLRSRFAEEGIDTHVTNVATLHDALASYLANDGSSIGQEQQERRQLYLQDQFALTGVGAIVEVLRSELVKLPAGQAFYVVSTAQSIESEHAFLSVVSSALARDLRLRLLVGDTPDSTDATGQGTRANDRITQAYLSFVSASNVQIRFASQIGSPFVSTGFCTLLLVPGRLCLHISQAMRGVSPVACGIRSSTYLAETEHSLSNVWAQATSAFENPREFTPRVVSGNMARFYYETAGLTVASDGLNPLFMSEGAFERLLEERGVSKSEREWRVEAHMREQEGMENQIARGVPYREMTTAVDASIIREQHAVAVYGTTLMDAQSVSVHTALDILQGYLRFATLYPHFDVRFANPSHELEKGLWMLSESSSPVRDDAGGVVWWHREKGGVRQLVSHHPRVMNAVRELFEDAWGRFRFRVWIDGRLVTSNEDADPSLTIHFIRQKIAELEDLAVM